MFEERLADMNELINEMKTTFGQKSSNVIKVFSELKDVDENIIHYLLCGKCTKLINKRKILANIQVAN